MRCCEPLAKVSVAEHGELLGRLVELAHLEEGSRMLLVLPHRLVPLPASSALDAELDPAPVQRVRAGPGVTEHVEAQAEDGKPCLLGCVAERLVPVLHRHGEEDRVRGLALRELLEQPVHPAKMGRVQQNALVELAGLGRHTVDPCGQEERRDAVGIAQVGAEGTRDLTLRPAASLGLR